MPRILPRNVRNEYYDVLYKNNPNNTIKQYVKNASQHFSVWKEGKYRTSTYQYEKEIRVRLEYYKQLK